MVGIQTPLHVPSIDGRVTDAVPNVSIRRTKPGKAGGIAPHMSWPWVMLRVEYTPT
jgi:hypothetical protein